MKNTFIFLQELLQSTAGIPLARIPYEKAALLEFLQKQTNYIFDFLFEQESAYWQPLLQIPSQPDTIYEFWALGGITFLVYVDSATDSIYCLGPVVTRPFSQEDILHDMERYRVSPEMRSLVLQYCSTIPMVSSHILYRTGDLTIGYLTGKDKPMNIVQANVLSPVGNYLVHQEVSVGEEIAKMRQVEMRYEFSTVLTDAVKQGNLSLALHMIGAYTPGEQNPVRNTNPLRNAQNYCIVLNTQLRHALEKSGVHPYRIDRLSNEIGLEIEQLKNISQLSGFFNSVIRRYCRLVQEHDYPHLKTLTNLAVTYIKEHLADNLTVKGTAQALTVNANYLSTLFHKEMGMTFIDFVNRERTRQAAALLTHTNLQIQQIASIVGYNNTSYFAKQFLRFQRTNPSHYRKGDV